MKKAIALITSLCVLGLSFPVNEHYHKADGLTANADSATTYYQDGFVFNIVGTEAQIVQCHLADLKYNDAIIFPDTYHDLPVRSIRLDCMSELLKNDKEEDITFVSLPSELNDIDITEFRVFNNLEKIAIDSSNPYFTTEDNVLYTKDKKEILLYPPEKAGSFYDISENTERIHDYAFSGSKYLKSVIIPESVSDIGDYAFSGCANLLEMRLPDAVNSNDCTGQQGVDNEGWK